jgi:uncharacterized membrane protein
MKLVQQEKETKTDQIFDLLLRRLYEEPEKAKITGLNFVGIFSPVLCFALISLNYIFSTEFVQTDKEVNYSLGLWVANTVLGVIYSLLIVAALGTSSSVGISTGYMQIAYYFGFYHYLYIGLVCLNAFRFIKARDPLHLAYMSLTTNYIKYLKKIKQQTITTT